MFFFVSLPFLSTMDHVLIDIFQCTLHPAHRCVPPFQMNILNATLPLSSICPLYRHVAPSKPMDHCWSNIYIAPIGSGPTLTSILMVMCHAHPSTPLTHYNALPSHPFFPCHRKRDHALNGRDQLPFVEYGCV